MFCKSADQQVKKELPGKEQEFNNGAQPKQSEDTQSLIAKLKEIETLQKSKLYLQVQQLEYDALKMTGLRIDEELHVFNIPVRLKDGTYQWLHTYKCGDQNDEPILLLHGYGGTSMTYYRMLKHLSKRYLVYCIDILGFGMSAHPAFSKTDQNEIIDYFVHSIEQWRIEMGIPKLLLAGHSFGGYLAAMYAVKYPQNLTELILLSPAGGTKYSQQDIKNMQEQFLSKLNWKQRFFLFFAKKAVASKMTPTAAMQKFWFPSSWLLNRYLNNRLNLPEVEKKLYKDYLVEVFKFPESTEKTFWELFQFPRACAIYSIEQAFEENIEAIKDLRIHFLFGDNDWMDQSGVKRMVQTQLIRGSLTIVRDSGHQLIFENPQETSDYLLNLPRQNIQSKSEIEIKEM